LNGFVSRQQCTPGRAEILVWSLLEMLLLMLIAVIAGTVLGISPRSEMVTVSSGPH
jgi:hypothetical protein